MSIENRSKDGYSEMVEICADVDWLQLSDEPLTDESWNSTEYAPTEIGELEYSKEASRTVVKCLAAAYQHLDENNSCPEIGYKINGLNGYVCGAQDDIHFMTQELPYADGPRIKFVAYYDRPSKYSNPERKAEFYSDFQETMEQILEEESESKNRETIIHSTLGKIKDYLQE